MRHKLKALRLELGLTQAQMARLMGTTKEYYGLIENGKRVGTVPNWIRLQRAISRKYRTLSNAELWEVVKEGVKFERKNKAC